VSERRSHEWTERDAALLELAVRQAADIDGLEADIECHGVRLENGRLNTALCEARQARVALGRLLVMVDIPDEISTAAVHATKAAKARWQEAG
jgi:hypothetical protein